MDASFRKLKGITFFNTYRKLELYHYATSAYSMRKQNVLDNPNMIKIIEEDGWTYDDFIEEYKKQWDWVKYRLVDKWKI